MDLSIIIVNYGTYELTKGAIESIIANNNLADNSYSFNPDSGVDSDSGADFGFDYEIILVDNDSPDDSYEKLINYFSDSIEKDLIKPIANKSNQGFAAANNIGIKIAKGDFILLLNSDTEVKENTLEECLNYIKDHEDIGAVGCKVLLPDGTLDKACKRSFPNPKNSFYKLFGFSNNKNNNYNLDCLDDDGVHEIDSLVGAFMLVRRATIDQIGLLDEDFFMYGEDIDWCYRIKKAGWKVIYYGKVEIIHYKGASSKKKKSKLIYEFYRAMYLFYNKHYKKQYSIFTRIAVYLGILVLLVIKLFLNIFKSDN